MISVLAQERVLGAALGSALAGFVVFQERKSIYASISEDRSRVSPRNQIQEPLLGKSSRSELAQMWNQAVDKTFGPVIEYLSSHGW
ncbi:hypothetical protein MLD38_009600 [Melastoma candidum]|uniref:Uncharacterized protein n=1 Tax=Melastoma candidum TaxID=119954 RepID=A0ACB9RXR5_9MYRT|nr:hypothetical protein MLD38_009600 [Melastoma candidum]